MYDFLVMNNSLQKCVFCGTVNFALCKLYGNVLKCLFEGHLFKCSKKEYYDIHITYTSKYIRLCDGYF